MTLIPIPFRQIGDVYQYLEIEAGESGTVFTLELPSGYVGFITEMHISWFPDTTVELKIDNFTELSLTRTIGKVEEPKEYEPPIIVHRKIEVIATNNSLLKHFFEALINGFAYGFAYELRRYRENAKVNCSS